MLNEEFGGRAVKSLLNRLTDWKNRCFYMLMQIHSAFADWDLRGIRSFSRINTGSAAGFRDPTRLIRWTRGFLYAHLAVVVVRLCILAFEKGGGSLELPPAATIISDALRLLVVYGTWVLVPLWTYRANHNARQLGASGMMFTPGWAAGWYFQPPGLFWKPYQVMKEIWQASVDPTDWRGQRGSPLLVWWWALWLIAMWGRLLVYGVAMLVLEPGNAQPVDSAIGLAGRLLHVPLTLLLLAIITKVHSLQMRHSPAE